MTTLSVMDIIYIGLGVIGASALIVIGIICYFRYRDPKPKEPRDLESSTSTPRPSVRDRELKTLGCLSPPPYQREHRRVLSAPAYFNDINIGAGHEANAQDEHGEIQLHPLGHNGGLPLPAGENADQAFINGVPLPGDNGHLLPIAPGDHGHLHLLGENNGGIPLPAGENADHPVINGVHLQLVNADVAVPNGGVLLPAGDGELVLDNGQLQLFNADVAVPNVGVPLPAGDGELVLFNGPGDHFDLPLHVENFLDGEEDDALLNVSPEDED